MVCLLVLRVPFLDLLLHEKKEWLSDLHPARNAEAFIRLPDREGQIKPNGHVIAFLHGVIGFYGNCGSSGSNGNSLLSNFPPLNYNVRSIVLFLLPVIVGQLER